MKIVNYPFNQNIDWQDLGLNCYLSLLTPLPPQSHHPHSTAQRLSPWVSIHIAILQFTRSLKGCRTSEHFRYKCKLLLLRLHLQCVSLYRVFERCAKRHAQCFHETFPILMSIFVDMYIGDVLHWCKNSIYGIVAMIPNTKVNLAKTWLPRISRDTLYAHVKFVLRSI